MAVRGIHRFGMDDMTDNEVCEPAHARLALRVTAEADPSALVRGLCFFQNLNPIPRTVYAELSATQVLRIRVDTTEVTEDRMTLIAAKIGQIPCVLNAYWPTSNRCSGCRCRIE
jgi:hypothetical protein